MHKSTELLDDKQPLRNEYVDDKTPKQFENV